MTQNDKLPVIRKIINEDGTDFRLNFPENPLKEKWDKLYPPNQRYKSGENCEGWSCMRCGLCPNGEYWKVPEEDREIWDKYQRQIFNNMITHNTSLLEKIEERIKMNQEELK